jgi:hypothetical protein
MSIRQPSHHQRVLFQVYWEKERPMYVHRQKHTCILYIFIYTYIYSYIFLHIRICIGVVDLPTITSSASTVLSIVGERASGLWLGRLVSLDAILVLGGIYVFIYVHMYVCMYMYKYSYI